MCEVKKEIQYLLEDNVKSIQKFTFMNFCILWERHLGHLLAVGKEPVKGKRLELNIQRKENDSLKS